jgi:flagellar hook-associated protein 1 FlgK
MNGISDNRTALAIAGLRQKPVMFETHSTMGDFLKWMIGNIGTCSESAKINMDKNGAVVNSLVNLRQEISGVNIDEELTKMLMFQHGYNASARLVSTVDRMLDTLIHMGA